MRFQFLSSLYAGIKKSLLRFPLPILMAVAATLAANYIITFNGQEGYANQVEAAMRIVRTCFIGFPMALGIVLFLEKNHVPPLIINFCRVLLASVLIAYYFTLPEHITIKEDVRFVMLTLAAHLLVSFLPFFDRNDNNGFWQYNRMLFMRLLTGLLYAAVLYLGLALALQAIDSLFEVNFPPKLYVRLLICIVGLFVSCFFLAGIPANIGNLRHETHYPKGLKIFAQFVLLPLVVVYLLILYSYSIKILVQWEWPQGWVSYLVIGFAVAGIFSFLLIEPIKHQQGNAWIKIYSKAFYIALFPLVVLLFLAIRVRIKEYGFTENRYFVIGLAIWLAGIALYFLFSKKKNIKIIPITLFVLTLLSIIGPWNAFKVAEWSQMRAFNRLVEQYNLLENGKFSPTQKEVPLEATKQLSSVIKFLHDRDQLHLLQPFYEEAVDEIAMNQDPESTVAELPEMNLMRAMGLAYVRSNDDESDEIVGFDADVQEVKVVSGYDLAVKYEYMDFASEEAVQHDMQFEHNGELYTLRPDSVMSSLQIYHNENFIAKFDLQALGYKLDQQYQAKGNVIPVADMTLNYSNGKQKIQLNLEHLSLKKKEEKYQVIGVVAEVLISL